MVLTNSQLKLYQSLNHKKYRQQYGLFIADGPHLVKEALKSAWTVERVIVRDDSLDMATSLRVSKNILTSLPTAKFDRLAPSESPQGILAIVRTKSLSQISADLIKTARQVIALDNITDPGNVGTIIRTAAAFGYDLVVCIGDCAEIYNSKTVRSTQGAIFTIPIIEIGSPKHFLETFARSFDIAVFTAKAKTPLGKAPRLQRPVLILGSEAAGVSAELEKQAKYAFRIEQSDKVESLNVAVAAGVAMYRFKNNKQ